MGAFLVGAGKVARSFSFQLAYEGEFRASGHRIAIECNEVAVDMSAEFQAQLDVCVSGILALIDIPIGSGRLWKWSDGNWAAAPPRVGSPLFVAGWDTLDTAKTFAGARGDVLKIYLSSEEHLRKRLIGASHLAQSGYRSIAGV